MEIASSALTGALKVGVQVLVGRKRPVIEIYSDLHNVARPPMEAPIYSADKSKVLRTDKISFQDIFITLTMINIGAVRAENVNLTVSGDFKRGSPREAWPELFNSIIHQMAPGQSKFLARIDRSDLHNYVAEPHQKGVYRASNLKSSVLVITVGYDAPSSIMNWFLRLPSRMRKRKQFYTTFSFDPRNFAGDLPPLKYE